MHWSAVLGMFGAVFFILEFLWNFVLASPELSEFHLMLMKTYVIGFSGMNFVSFVLGVIQWFIFGAILGGIIQAISSCCKCMKGGKGCDMKGGCACGGKGCGACKK